MKGSENSASSLNSLELQAFSLPLAAAVAATLGVFCFESMSERDLREAIKAKDPSALLLMDEYFQKLLECGKVSTMITIESREKARLKLVARTQEICNSN